MDAGNTSASSFIGVFDSGVGGLSVLRQIRRQLPDESFVYIADSRYAPYGEKSPAFIQQRSLALTGFLVERGAKLVVVACNTATAAAVHTLREHFSLPIVAMEPAVKPAVKLTRVGKIGVLATTGTLSSARFAALLDRFGSDTEVHTRSCDGWVERVEQGDWQSAEAFELVRRHVVPLIEKGVDTLILGCTHYPFLRSLIREVAGNEVALVDTGEAVARRVAQVLGDTGLLSMEGKPVQRFYTSLTPDGARDVIARLWGAPVETVSSLPDNLLTEHVSA